MKELTILLAFVFCSIGNMRAIKFETGDISFSKTLCYKKDGRFILSKYLFIKNHVATLFAHDIKEDEIYIAEHYKKNGQYVTLFDNMIDFTHCSGVYAVYSSYHIVISNLDFCGFYYKEWEQEHKLTVINSFRVNNGKGVYFVHLLKTPETGNYTSLYTQNILCYKNAGIPEYPDAFIEFNFFLNTPITYMMKYKYRDYFFKQLKLDISRSKVSMCEIKDGC